MKKTNLFLTSVAVAAALAVGSANAAPNRGGGNHHAPRPFVTHTHGAPRHGGHPTAHHNPPPAPMPVQVSHHHHHHHHHGVRTGDWIVATAILLSAII